MNRLDRDWAPLDNAYRGFPGMRAEHFDAWLLEQTISTAAERRRLLETVPLTEEPMSILDVGTGFGPMAFEIAHLTRAKVTGIDLDESSLVVAREVASSVGPWLHQGSDVHFERCDLDTLPSELGRIAPEVVTTSNPGFDLAVVRLVLQHHRDPQAAIASIAEVVRHGGYLWIFDVDDGLSASWPPASHAHDELESAFRSWQASYGGDREIGRKLPAIANASNLLVREVRANTSAAWITSRPGDLLRTSVTGRIRNVMASMIAGGFISAQRCDELLTEIEVEPPSARMQVESQIIVVAQRP